MQNENRKPYKGKHRGKLLTERIGVMNLILVFIAIAAISFTVVMIRLFVQTGMIPDTLCTCVFSMLGGECGFMAVIKSFKEKSRDRSIELEDRKYYEEKSKQASDAGCLPN